MTKAKADGVLLLILGSLVFVLLGSVLESASPATMGDFKVMYFPARCLLEHGDPYKAADVLRIYRSGEGRFDESSGGRLMVPRSVYLPSAFSFTVPFALAPYRVAHIGWMLASFAILILSAFLVWDLASDYATLLSAALAAFVIGNCEIIVTNGNVAGICVGLCVIAVWCFLKNRFVAIGVISLAVSLSLKPHDAGFVWLYFALVGGRFRKCALATLAATIALALAPVLWISHVSPDWVEELRSNMLAYSAPGDFNDQGPTSIRANKPSMIIDLQTAIALVDDNPKIYNSTSYLVCGALVVGWCLTSFGVQPSREITALALATIAPLTMLPVYHRECDAKLLLLTIPACAMLWSKRGKIGRIAMGFTFAGLLVTADLLWAIDVYILSHLHKPGNGFSGQLLVASQVLFAPMILLAESFFFLWVYVRRQQGRSFGNADAAGAGLAIAD